MNIYIRVYHYHGVDTASGWTNKTLWYHPPSSQCFRWHGWLNTSLYIIAWNKHKTKFIKTKVNYNMTSFIRFANKGASYLFGIISLAHARWNVTDFHWQHKLCATFSANINIKYRLPICRICTLIHIRIEINHESQNVFWALTWIGRY
jgi:hypothetical protein